MANGGGATGVGGNGGAGGSATTSATLSGQTGGGGDGSGCSCSTPGGDKLVSRDLSIAMRSPAEFLSGLFGCVRMTPIFANCQLFIL